MTSHQYMFGVHEVGPVSKREGRKHTHTERLRLKSMIHEQCITRTKNFMEF